MDTYKTLNTRKKKLSNEISLVEKDIRELDAMLIKKRGALRQIENQINQLQKKDIIVTEHAVLRYLERVQGIDLDYVKFRILTDKLKEQVETLGDGHYPVDGFTAVVKSNTVITIK